MEALHVRTPLSRADALEMERLEADRVSALSEQSGTSPEVVARTLAFARQIADRVIPPEKLPPALYVAPER